MPAGTARRDALRLTKKKAKLLPRVTAYATAGCVLALLMRVCSLPWAHDAYRSYRFQDLMKFFNARRASYHTDPRMIDDVIYSPYVYDPPSALSAQVPGQSPTDSTTADLLGVPELRPSHPVSNVDPGDGQPGKRKMSKFDTTANEAEIFLFPYGTVVIWGMAEAQERRFLSSL